MNNPISGARAKVNSIHDNLGKDLDKYDIASYLDRSEAGNYLKKIPGIKDLLLKLKKFFSMLKGILDKIFKFIDMLLSILEKIFDKVEELLEAILNALNSFLEGFGLHIGFKNSILESLLTNCITIEHTDKFKPDILLGVILGVLVGFATCEGDAKAFSHTYNIYVNSGEIGDTKDEINSIKDEIRNLPKPSEIITIENSIKSIHSDLFNLLKDNDNLKDRVKSLEDRVNILDSYRDEYERSMNGNDKRDIDNIILTLQNSIKEKYNTLYNLILNSNKSSDRYLVKIIKEYERSIEILKVTKNNFINGNLLDIDSIESRVTLLEGELKTIRVEMIDYVSDSNSGGNRDLLIELDNLEGRLRELEDERVAYNNGDRVRDINSILKDIETIKSDIKRVEIQFRDSVLTSNSTITIGLLEKYDRLSIEFNILQLQLLYFKDKTYLKDLNSISSDIQELRDKRDKYHHLLEESIRNSTDTTLKSILEDINNLKRSIKDITDGSSLGVKRDRVRDIKDIKEDIKESINKKDREYQALYQFIKEYKIDNSTIESNKRELYNRLKVVVDNIRDEEDSVTEEIKNRLEEYATRIETINSNYYNSIEENSEEFTQTQKQLIAVDKSFQYYLDNLELNKDEKDRLQAILNSLKDIIEDFTNLIRDIEIRNRLEELDRLEKQLYLLEKSIYGDELKELEGKLLEKERVLENLIYKANEEFKLIASLSLSVILNSTTISIENSIYAISDIISIEPGRDAFDTIPNLVELLSIGIDKKIRDKFDLRDILIKNPNIIDYDLVTYTATYPIRDILLKDKTVEDIFKYKNGREFLKLFRGDAIFNSSYKYDRKLIKELTTVASEVIELPIRYQYDIGDRSYLIDDPVTPFYPKENFIYNFNLLFKQRDVEEIIHIFKLLNILDSEERLYLTRIPFIRSILYYYIQYLPLDYYVDECTNDRSELETPLILLGLL